MLIKRGQGLDKMINIETETKTNTDLEIQDSLRISRREYVT